MNEKVEILGVKIDKVTMDDALIRAKDYIENPELNVIYTPNSEIIKGTLGYVVCHQSITFCIPVFDNALV